MIAALLVPMLMLDPAPGIPVDLATARAREISNVRYHLSLKVPAERAAPIEGQAHIQWDLRGDSPVVLDFAPGEKQILQSSVAYRAVNGHIILPAGTREVRLTFRLGDAPLNRNNDFFYSLFVPARAHLAIPCFDQPDLKARYTVTIQAPEGWKTLLNQEAGVETQPIPTYLLFFGAGRFEMETAELNGRRYRMFHRETDRAKVERNRATIFELHDRALHWMQDYTGIAYPFGKFDFLAVPSFQFGGMEHPGAISYNSGGLFLDESATQAQKLGRASVIAHETAHMWFGDLVTMRWFNDVWLKEVFANFMAAKIVNPSFPELNHDLRFFLSHYRAAYNVDRTAGANPIRQGLENLNEAGSLYGPIIYQKAPIVMRQLETMLGEADFRAGLQRYLKQYSFSNATWDQLIAAFGRDLTAWSKIWIDSPGRPKVTKTKKYEGFTLPDGYGEYHLDAASKTYLLRNLPSIADPLVRAEAWSALWEDHVDVFELALKAIPQEKEELNLTRLLGDLDRIQWRHAQDLDRVAALLKAGLDAATTRSIRSAYFNSYIRVAPADWIEQVWSKKVTIPDLPLSEPDYIRMAAELTLRGRDVRTAMLERIENPDRKAQWAFVSGALDADPSAWVASLSELKNRAKEPWVLEGLSYVHHPRRKGAGERFIRTGLDLTEEIRRTGDIFFPQRWAMAILTNYTTPSAAATVRDFLKVCPPKVRRHVLVAADDLLWLADNTGRPARDPGTRR